MKLLLVAALVVASLFSAGATLQSPCDPECPAAAVAPPCEPNCDVARA
jgi:hypothetical protein